jgi:hypothetical protein
VEKALCDQGATIMNFEFDSHGVVTHATQ